MPTILPVGPQQKIISEQAFMRIVIGSFPDPLHPEILVAPSFTYKSTLPVKLILVITCFLFFVKTMGYAMFKE